MISNRLHDYVQEGDIVELTAPSGTFVLKKSVTKPKVFISGGIGQTPLMAVLEDLVKNKSEEIRFLFSGYTVAAMKLLML